MAQLVSSRAGIQEQTFCSKPGSQSRPGPASGGRGLRPQRQPFLLLVKASVRPQKAGEQPCCQIPGLLGILGVSWHLPPGELEVLSRQGGEMEGGMLCLHRAAAHVWEGKGLLHAGAPRGFFWSLPESRGEWRGASLPSWGSASSQILVFRESSA